MKNSFLKYLWTYSARQWVPDVWTVQWWCRLKSQDSHKWIKLTTTRCLAVFWWHMINNARQIWISSRLSWNAVFAIRSYIGTAGQSTLMHCDRKKWGLIKILDNSDISSWVLSTHLYVRITARPSRPNSKHRLDEIILSRLQTRRCSSNTKPYWNLPKLIKTY